MTSKKLITAISMACLMAVLLVVGVWAVSDIDFSVGGDIEYTAPVLPTLDESEYPTLIFEPIDATTCSVADNGSSGALVIPEKVLIDGAEYTVTEFAEGDMYEPGINGSFISNRNITSIEIPGTIETISEYEFYHCGQLTNVIIKEGVKNVNSYAFANCNLLTTISVPDSVEDFSSNVFAYGTSQIQYNKIDNGNYVGNKNNPYLVLIGLQDTSASSFAIADGCTTIAGYAFFNCTFTEVSVPDSISNLSTNALYGCSGLALTEYSNAQYFGTTSNPYMLLIKATSKTITSCEIHNSCTSITNDAFYDCKLLENVTIGSGVKNIGRYAFLNCTSLTTITIPDSVTKADEGVFSGCTALKSVTIGSGIKNISHDFFINCKTLSSITIPNSVTSIGYFAFSGCIGLTSIIIPDSVTSISDAAFLDCTGLTRVELGSGVKSISNSVFNGCTGLETIIVESGNTKYNSNNNCNAIIETSTNTLILGCKNTVIPSTVTSIGNYAFEDCTGLTTITIPDSVTSIGQSAFNGCTGLETIIVESGNTVYNSNNNCNAIIETSTNTLIAGCKNTVIPSTVTSIGYYAFSGCTGLTTITIPNRVTSIGWFAFEDCTGLTSITIPDSVTSIGYSAFSGCTNLTYHTYSGAKYLGNSTNKYVVLVKASSTYITSCTINSGCKVIYEKAFQDCRELTSITIPNSVTSIGDDAFDGCTTLATVEVKATTPPTLSGAIFFNCPLTTGIFVPSASVSAYKSATSWSVYSSKIQAGSF